MPTLSMKENFFRALNREVPEFIPTYDLFWGFAPPPFPMGERNPDGSGKDMFGVESRVPSGYCDVPMPVTDYFILEDITKWRDVIKIPDFDLDDSAWEAMGKEALDKRNPDIPAGGGIGTGYFLPLMNFMGFTNGLIACHEEPEEVKALMDYLCTWSCEMNKKYIHYFKPEFGGFGDDIAHERDPFLSLEMFQELIAPYWRRYYDTFNEAGLRTTHHNCGHFELYVDDLVSMGVSLWEPAQSSNDYDAIKARHGNNLILCCVPETRFWDESTTEEEVRAATRDLVNRLAPGGGYAMFEFFYNPFSMPGVTEVEARHMGWVVAEFEEMRYDFYK